MKFFCCSRSGSCYAESRVRVWLCQGAESIERNVLRVSPTGLNPLACHECDSNLMQVLTVGQSRPRSRTPVHNWSRTQHQSNICRLPSGDQDRWRTAHKKLPAPSWGRITEAIHFFNWICSISLENRFSRRQIIPPQVTMAHHPQRSLRAPPLQVLISIAAGMHGFTRNRS